MASKKNETREIYTVTRYAWKDGSRICINLCSVKEGNVTSYHTVNIYLDGSHADSCTCAGFGRWGHCCHLDHYRLAEGLSSNKALAIAALVTRINAKFGAVVVRVGVPVPVVSPVPATKPKRADLAPLNGNRAFSVLKRSA